MKKQFIEKRELNDFIAMSLLIFFAGLPLVFHKIYGYLPVIWLKEDGIYESVAAIACIATGLALTWSGVNNHCSSKSIFFWLFACAFSLLVLGGEELSWGQRLFNFEIPEHIADTNFQRELNLHNSKFIQAHNNAFSTNLTRLLIVYLIIFPVFLRAFPTANRFAEKLSVPVPGLAVALAVLISQIISTQTFRFVYGSTEIVDDLSLGEVFESILELSLCWVAWNYMGLIKKGKK